MNKRALIVVNHIGFIHFIAEDIDILRELGYEVDFAFDNSAGEDYSIKLACDHGAANLYDIPQGLNTSIFSRDKIACCKEFRKLLTDNEYDLIICHTSLIGFIVRLAARAAKVRKRGGKVVYFSHGLYYNRISSLPRKIVFGIIERKASRWTDAIICINTEDYNRLLKMRCRSVYKIPGVGVEVNRFREETATKEEVRAELGISRDALVVLSVARLKAVKNHPATVQAVGGMKNKDNVVLVICGGDSDGGITKAKIESEAKRLGVKVILTGHRNDIPRIMRCADIGVLPSLREGLAVSGLEFLSCGIPIVGTDIQGIKEYTIEDHTGALIPTPFDIAAYTAALERLSNPEVRAAMKRDCQEMVNRFSKENSLAARRRVYSEISQM